MDNFCIHCTVRVVKVNFLLGEKWMHQIKGMAFQDGMYEFCKRSIATPAV